MLKLSTLIECCFEQQIIFLFVKVTALFTFYAVPSSGKLKGALVRWFTK